MATRQGKTGNKSKGIKADFQSKIGKTCKQEDFTLTISEAEETEGGMSRKPLRGIKAL